MIYTFNRYINKGIIAAAHPRNPKRRTGRLAGTDLRRGKERNEHEHVSTSTIMSMALSIDSFSVGLRDFLKKGLKAFSSSTFNVASSKFYV